MRKPAGHRQRFGSKYCPGRPDSAGGHLRTAEDELGDEDRRAVAQQAHFSATPWIDPTFSSPRVVACQDCHVLGRSIWHCTNTLLGILWTSKSAPGCSLSRNHPRRSWHSQMFGLGVKRRRQIFSGHSASLPRTNTSGNEHLYTAEVTVLSSGSRNSVEYFEEPHVRSKFVNSFLR